MKGKTCLFFLLFFFLAGCSPLSTSPLPTPALEREQPLPQPATYGYSLLSTQGKEAYSSIVTGLQQRPLKDKVPLPSTLSPTELMDARQMVFYDHPEFYWADYNIQILESTYQLHIQPKDPQNMDQVDVQLQELKAAAKEILAPVYGESDYEKLLFIHDYLATTVIYDYGFKIQYSGTAYGSLMDGVGYCDGFARGFQYLAQEAGLNQVYVQGWDLKGTSHAWNGVETEQGWLYTDTTWDRYSNDYGGAYHNFAAMTLEESLRERRWDDTQYADLPPSLKEGASYYYTKNYLVDLNTTPTFSESLPLLTQLIQRQLEEHQHLKADYEYAFLELEVVGSKEDYLLWKRQFMQDVFIVLEQTQQLLDKNSRPFSIEVSSTVSCYFNDSMQIVSFYPKIKKTL